MIRAAAIAVFIVVAPIVYLNGAFGGEIDIPLRTFPQGGDENEARPAVTSADLDIQQPPAGDDTFTFSFKDAEDPVAELTIAVDADDDFAPFEMVFNVPFFWGDTGRQLGAALVKSKIEGNTKEVLISSARALPNRTAELIVLHQRARVVWRAMYKEFQIDAVRRPNADDAKVAFIFVQTGVTLAQTNFLAADDEMALSADWLRVALADENLAGLFRGRLRKDAEDLVIAFDRLEIVQRQRLVDAIDALFADEDTRPRGCILARRLADDLPAVEPGVKVDAARIQNTNHLAVCATMQANMEEANRVLTEATALQETIDRNGGPSMPVIDALGSNISALEDVLKF